MKRLCLSTLLALALSPLAHAAPEAVALQPVRYAPAVTGNQKLIKECDVSAKIQGRTAERLQQLGLLSKVGATGGVSALQITIESVEGRAGGAFSGPKTVQLKLELTRGETLIRSGSITRKGIGKGIAGLRGSCGTMDGVAGEVADDVANWLSPGIVPQEK